MDKRDRDDFYMSTPDDGDNGDDYELEPPDAEVIAAEERRGQETIEATHASIDIDEIYRDADRERSQEILENWFRNFRFRFQFQVKHLLIATAVVAIMLTLYKLELLGTAMVLLVMFSVAGLYFYLQWQERKAQEEANQRRQEMYARRRAHMAKMSGSEPSSQAGEDVITAAASKNIEPLPNSADETWPQAMEREKFRFHFSMAELMIAFTVAALILGMVQLLGSASSAATLLGFLALIGLAAHALGFEPPSVVVLGWWLILVLYVLLSIFAAMWSSFA